ncbi:o-succinylbenzoate--CoA ligase [Allosaccharopolyspora coralli]|uniref:o-succinylbenzoate--CoA ligase n=1 Tax=Allosaccharopolyspora coralli TaxID=2665642 RepID=UPI001E2C0C03|nr:o-succinylbenzoate--CoA ligase [Allosaccharopolyspora coralli]
MSPGRVVEALPIRPGNEALEALPALSRALEGDGPALLPVAPDGENARELRTALGVGEPLLAHEDDTMDPTSVVIGTSGSTGVPKGVLLPNSALRASAEATEERLDGPGTWLLALPPHHVAGLQVLMRALISGTEPCAVDVRDGFRPDAFVEAATEVFATWGPYYTSLVPTQLARLIDDPDSLRALRQFDAILLGGAAAPQRLLQRAQDEGVPIVRTYGMSETAGGCVYDGMPLDGVRVAVEPPEPGRIHLYGPMVARGYRYADSEAFSDFGFRTDDVGQVRDRRLEVLGRVDDMIVTGGVNVAPVQAERPLTDHPGVREACVVGLDDPEWGQIVAAAVVVSDPSAPPDTAELREAVRSRAGAEAAPKRIVAVEELPLRGPGKVDRAAVRDLLGRQ